jgi:hypothetical protein
MIKIYVDFSGIKIMELTGKGMDYLNLKSQKIGF